MHNMTANTQLDDNGQLIGLRCEMPIIGRSDDELCALWDEHNGQCLTYSQVISWVIVNMSKHIGFRSIAEVPDAAITMWSIRAGFKYKAKVVARHELEDTT